MGVLSVAWKLPFRPVRRRNLLFGLPRPALPVLVTEVLVLGSLINLERADCFGLRGFWCNSCLSKW